MKQNGGALVYLPSGHERRLMIEKSWVRILKPGADVIKAFSVA